MEVQNRLLTAYSFSYLADGIFISSLPLLAVSNGSSLSSSAIIVGLFNFPWIFSAASGKIIDSHSPIKILKVSNVFRSLLSLLVVLIFLFPAYYDINILYATAIGIGICEVFYENTLPTIPARILKREEFVDFNSKSEFFSRFLKMIIGKFLGPILVGIQPFLAPLFNVFLFFSTSLFLKNKDLLKIKKSSDFSESPLNASTWILNNRVFLKLTLMSFLVNAIFTTVLSMMPIYLISVLNYSEYFAGAAMGLMGAGYLIGAVLNQNLQSNKLAPIYIYTDFGIFVSFLLMSLTVNLFAIYFCMLLFGICMSVRNITGWTYMQQVMPRNLAGRITSIQRTFGWGGCAVGPFLGALILEYHSIQAEIIFCCSLSIITLLISISLARKNSLEFVIET